MSSDPSLSKAEAIQLIKNAQEELGAALRRQMNREHAFKLTIPVNEAKDSDVIIGRGLDAALSLLSVPEPEQPCKFKDGRCTVCGEPESGMCNRPDDPVSVPK